MPRAAHVPNVHENEQAGEGILRQEADDQQNGTGLRF